MRDFLYDLRSSFRCLRRRPLYPIIAIGILAIGLSASVSVFTYINSFQQPFPGANTDGLVRVFGMDDDNPYQDISYLDFLDFATASAAFAGLAATQPYYAASVRHEEFTEVAFLEAVSGDYFSVLDVELKIGRSILPADDRPGAEAVAVLSHSWWMRSFGGDPNVLGQVVYLNYRPFVVVGVAAPEFLGTTSDVRPDVWIPIAPFRDRYTSWARQAENRDLPLVRVFGRLRSGWSRSQGLSELRAIAAGLDDLYPRQDAARAIRTEAATWIDPRSRLAEQTTVRLMMGAAVGLLLLVCANVSNLLLSVALGRQREMAVRAAIGASPSRLVRQVILENVSLGLIAGAVAVGLAAPATARLGSYFARPSVWGENVAREAFIDTNVLLFAILISAATGLVAGLLPAIRASCRNVVTRLKIDGVGSLGRPRRLGRLRLPGMHDLLVSIQVSLCIVLLVIASLVLRTLASASSLDPGFSYDRLVMTHVSTSSTGVVDSTRAQFFRELAESVAQEPWVASAAVVDYAPLQPHRAADLRLDGQAELAPIVYSKVLPGFFDALNIGVFEGRCFAPGDTAGAPNVVLVNQLLADRYFGGETAVGRRIWWPGQDGAEDREFEIVGVVADVKFQDFFTEPEPMAYFSYPQHGYPTGSVLLISSNIDPGASAPRLFQWLRGFEPHLAIVNVVTYPDVVSGFLYTHRMNAELFSVLAFVGLSLAGVGIFSVLSLAVGRRTREIGIRMSVGANRADLWRMVVRLALTPVLLGVVLGLGASFAVTGLVRSILLGVEPNDPISLAIGTVVLVLVALVAAYLPAHRAAGVDPVTALRQD